MKRLILLLLALALPLGAAPIKRYIVTLQPTVSASSTRSLAARVLSSSDADVARRAARQLDVINGFAAALTDDEVAALKQAPAVRSIDPVVERHLLDESPASLAPRAAATSFPYAAQQVVPYGIDLVRAREVWPYGRGKGVNVVVLDTGITVDHPDLKGQVAGGYNTLDRNDNYIDDHGHGTHVSGTIAAIDNGIGVVGVAPEARLWALKVLASTGNGTNEDVILAIDWILAKKKEIGGNWIMSMSFGSGETSPPEEEAFRRVRDADVLPVAAAGNTGFFALEYPAAYASVMSVGAVDSNKVGAWFSSGGGTLGIMAPGVDVLSTVPMGTVPSSAVQRGTARATGLPLLQSGRGDVTAPVVLCGFGSPGECGDATGKIALMSRGGDVPFAEKVRNALNSGAVAAIIANYDDTQLFPWTLIRRDCESFVMCVDNRDDVAMKWPVVIAVTKSQGDLLAKEAGPINVGVWDDDYGMKSGTSMSAPHAAGVAALLWSVAPDAHALDIRRVIELTAHDLGPQGYDPNYGNGMIDAYDAAKTLAPAAFGLPPAPLPQPGHRRVAHP